jgi:hypothetical protein
LAVLKHQQRWDECSTSRKRAILKESQQVTSLDSSILVNSPHKRQDHNKPCFSLLFSLLFVPKQSSCPTTCIRQSTIESG